METEHFKREQEFWDNKTSQGYSVLSAHDQKRLKQWIGDDVKGNVLDLGGGSGAVSKLFMDRQDVWSVCLDISFNLLKFAHGTRVQADALKIPFQDESQDLITLAAFVHHLPGLERELLQECYRVLKPGGRIIGFDPSATCLANRIFMNEGPLRLKVFSPDERPVDPEQLKSAALDCGFTSYSQELFSLRYEKVTAFEFIQRYCLNPLALGPAAKYLHRWFFWQANKA